MRICAGLIFLLAKICAHGGKVMILPAFLIAISLPIGNVRVDQGDLRPIYGFFEQDFYTRVRAAFGELTRPPGLEDATVRFHFERFAPDVPIPG